MQQYEVIAFAEKMITLLNTGAKNTTYKYAVLIGLLDLVFEAEVKDQAAIKFTTENLAEKVLALYWRQSTPYDKTNAVLWAAKGRKQAKIIKLIESFQVKQKLTSLHKAKQQKKHYHPLKKKVERILIEMPLPKLQKFGGSEERFIYSISWCDNTLDAKQVTTYLLGKPSTFDNGIYIQPQVLEYLRALNGLLRPLVKQAWLMDVAKMNGTDESQLDDFLFGSDRKAISTFADALYMLQGKVCFYCQKPINSAMQVDHFIPWSRYANDSLANLLATHEKCNNNKRDHICTPDIYQRWQQHIADNAAALEVIAAEKNWEAGIARSLNIADNIYQALDAQYLYWQGVNDFTHADKLTLKRSLSSLNNPISINKNTASQAEATNDNSRVAIDYFESLEIACGHFRQSSAEECTKLTLPDKYSAHPKKDFIAKAKGHSMEGGKNPIKDGDLLLFERITPQAAGSNQGQVIAIEKIDATGDTTYLLRSVKKIAVGQYQLVAYNPEYTVQAADETMHTIGRLKAVINDNDLVF